MSPPDISSPILGDFCLCPGVKKVSVSSPPSAASPYPTHPRPHMVRCHSRTLQQTSKCPHPLNNVCAADSRLFLEALKVGEYRPCRPSGAAQQVVWIVSPIFSMAMVLSIIQKSAYFSHQPAFLFYDCSNHYCE